MCLLAAGRSGSKTRDTLPDRPLFGLRIKRMDYRAGAVDTAR